MMKRQTILALGQLVLIPVVVFFGGVVSSLINPEIAAGHPQYARNFHILMLVKEMAFLGSVAVAGILWLLVCFLLIRAKERSLWWMFVALLGPFGLPVLATLNDRVPAETDRYSRFVNHLHPLWRAAYEVAFFVAIWFVAFEAMVLKRNLMILYQSATTGVPTAQIIDLQNASSGMWAFGEGLEVLFLVLLFYVIRPMVFNLVARLAAMKTSPTAH